MSNAPKPTNGSKQPHSHNHTHDHTAQGNIGLAFFLNLIFAVIEITGGILTNSIAIISDAIHDFGDCISLALAWYFQRMSKKNSTARYTYGYKRFSLLGAVINSIVLTAGSIFILSKAIPRLFSPQETHAAGMFWLAVIGIIANGIAVLRTRNAHSANERLVSLHLLEDVLGWAAVLVGAAIMYFTGFTAIDPILSIIIACFVLFNVFRNIRRLLPIILQGSPAELERRDILEELQKNDRISNIHDLHIWSLDEKYNVLTMHITLKESLPMDKLAELKNDVRMVLKEKEISHATIEFESPEESCGFEDCV